MSFRVEDGTVVIGANSFATLDQAEEFHTDRNNEQWLSTTLTDEAREAALIWATLWLARGPFRWIGEVSSSVVDRLPWPRTDAYWHNDELYTGIPTELVDATCELAGYHLTSPLNKSGGSGKQITGVDVGPVSISYFGLGSRLREMPAVNLMLRTITRNKGSRLQRRLTRG